MLKLNYTDSGLFLEFVSASLETIATQRVMLAVYAGEPLYVEPGRASFLLLATLPGLGTLQSLSSSDSTPSDLTNSGLTNSDPGVTIAPVDQEFVEVSLKGTWIAQSAAAEDGTFIAILSPEQEALIYELWQTTQPPIASLCSVH